VAHPHRALRTLELGTRVEAALLAQPRELAEARFEDRLQPADATVAVGGGAVELAQVGARPEPALEVVGLAVGVPEDARLAEDDHPAEHRPDQQQQHDQDRKSTRLNSSHVKISYAVFCLKKKKNM